MRAQLYSVFATLRLGMEVLGGEGVRVDRMLGHGGVFRTADVAQRALAAALNVPVAVRASASEGGAWGIALLAAYLDAADELSLSAYLEQRVFARDDASAVDPEPGAVAGFDDFLARFRAGLDLERAAVAAGGDRGERGGRTERTDGDEGETA
jgi:sugar (pentulose or hexulose) kinase